MNIFLIIQENPALHSLYRAVSKVVKVVPYYLFREFLTDEAELNLKPDLDRWEISVLEPPDMKEISANPEVPESEDILLDRLADGFLCLGLKHNGAIAAYTWSDFNKCSYEKILSFPLKEDEACLFDMRTLKSYRGKNIAPYLRYQLYKYLVQIGRTKFYSITIMSNTSSYLFKIKLKAKPYKLYLGMKFLNKYTFNICLKDYATQKI